MPRKITLDRRVERLDEAVAKLLTAQARCVKERHRDGLVSERATDLEDRAHEKYVAELNALRQEIAEA